jgi:hypothetical protein
MRSDDVDEREVHTAHEVGALVGEDLGTGSPQKHFNAANQGLVPLFRNGRHASAHTSSVPPASAVIVRPHCGVASKAAAAPAASQALTEAPLLWSMSPRRWSFGALPVPTGSRGV